VESTLRDAFFLHYSPVLIADAAMAAGSPAMHDATVFKVESFFGWTVTAEELMGMLRVGCAIQDCVEQSSPSRNGRAFDRDVPKFRDGHHQIFVHDHSQL
jgi:hypothetical protein